MNSSKIRVMLLVCFLISIVSCKNENKRLKIALELAGDNKEELLKVINHYQAPKDSLKLKAAYFLIENMPYHFSYDTTFLYRYRPVIEDINLLRTHGFSKKKYKRAS